MLKSMVKAAIGKVQGELRRREIERTARHVDRSTLGADIAALGIRPGDNVFLHSSLKSLGFVEGGPSAVIGALLDVIGPQGTLVVPTYYQPGGTIFRTCQLPDYIFDIAVHGTGLGALPSAFLKLPGVCRSLHPTHSVSALGPQAAFITEAHHVAPSIFGRDSPWERFLRLDGKVLGLGITMGPVTFYHMLEDLTGDPFPLPVRMKEAHPLRCREPDGTIVTVPVVPLDPEYMPRRIDNPSRDDLREYFWGEFTRAGLLTTGQVGESTSWFIGAQDFYRHLEALMHQGITIYSTPLELAARPLP
jgi:aminoglycoside 3-N-acetyltransferase